MSGFNIDMCPRCGSTSVLVRVNAWMTFIDGEPESLGREDIGYAVPLIGSEAFCEACCRSWRVAWVASAGALAYELASEHERIEAMREIEAKARRAQLHVVTPDHKARVAELRKRFGLDNQEKEDAAAGSTPPEPPRAA